MIKKIFINNFKSIKNLELELNSGVTVITGMNNSGKTNLMEAINVLVNDEYFPSKVNECFYFEENQPEADFFEISAIVNIDNLENWVANSSSGKVAVRSTTFPENKDIWYTKSELARILLNKDLVVSKKLERDNPKQYKEVIYFKRDNNGAIEDCEFDGYSFLSLAYPGAGLGTDKSAKNSLLTYKTTWFGKLIDSVIDGDKKEKIASINKRIINNEEFQNLEKEISEGFFGTHQNLIPSILGIRKASISYIPSDRNIRTSFDVKVHDGKEEKIENKSTGTQFITVIELFLNYINKFNRNGILSIDEIESTLHPTIAKKVVSIASKKVKQLIFTTHSKDLLRIVPFANIVKVAKNNNVSEVNVLQNNPNKLYPLIYQWPEIFFNDSLLVCEGKESALIESFIANDTILSKNAAALNLEVINGGGRAVSQFLTHASLIKGKINCAFIYDAEYLDKKRKEEYSITLKMLKFNSANMEDIALFESFSTFEERKSF